jgi:L-lactate dehydrogenase complex protein LldF
VSETTFTGRPVLDPAHAPGFPQAAIPLLRNTQLRRNVANATDTIETKRRIRVAEKADWQQLRDAASAIRDRALSDLGSYLEEFETNCIAAGGVVHWAANAEEARQIVLRLRDVTPAHSPSSRPTIPAKST